MKKILKSFRYGQRGFTLIELLIVVAILGILAAVLIPNLLSMIGTGTVAAANTELENVKSSSLAYYVDHDGTWPATSDDLGGYVAGTLKAKYTFDSGATGTGFIYLGAPTDTGWTGITWVAPAGGAGTYTGYGKWIKKGMATTATP